MPKTALVPYVIFVSGGSKTGVVQLEIATEEELLAFCNKVREAGGTTILEELLPSNPGKSESCLIANALNFGCRVRPDQQLEDGSFKEWRMMLPLDLTPEQQRNIAKAVGSNVKRDHDYSHPYVVLPRVIGNAAQAFDARAAFTEYIEGTYAASHS